jgi:hypothetical protein
VQCAFERTPLSSGPSVIPVYRRRVVKAHTQVNLVSSMRDYPSTMLTNGSRKSNTADEEGDVVAPAHTDAKDITTNKKQSQDRFHL